MLNLTCNQEIKWNQQVVFHTYKTGKTLKSLQIQMLIKVCCGLNVCIPGDGIRRWDFWDMLKSWEWSPHEWNYSWPLNHTEVRGANPPHNQKSTYNFWLYSWPFASADSTTVDGKYDWESTVGNAEILFSTRVWLNPWMWNLWIQRANCIYWKKSELSGPEQFKPVFKVQR